MAGPVVGPDRGPRKLSDRLGASVGPPAYVQFLASGTFTATQDGPVVIYARTQGGFGAVSTNAGSNNRAPGGSSGAASKKTVNLTKGQQLAISFSAGNIRITGPGVDMTLTAAADSSVNGDSGAPGTASGGDLNYNGSRGGSPNTPNAEAGAGPFGGAAGTPATASFGSSTPNTAYAGAGSPGLDASFPGSAGGAPRALSGSSFNDPAKGLGAGSGGLTVSGSSTTAQTRDPSLVQILFNSES